MVFQNRRKCGWRTFFHLERIDTTPSLYVYFQEYTVPGTSDRRVRKGFIALGRVEDYSSGVVFRHEQTLSGPKADRLELLRHTRTHTGQLFMLYSDAAARVDALLDAAARGPRKLRFGTNTKWRTGCGR